MAQLGKAVVIDVRPKEDFDKASWGRGGAGSSGGACCASSEGREGQAHTRSTLG